MKRITLSRFPAWLTAVFLVLGIACDRENPDPVPSDPAVTLTRPDQTYQAKDLFYQSQYITDALALEPRSSDGMLMFSFSTSYSNTSFRYAPPILENPAPNTLSTTETVPSGTTSTAFHMEFPMTVGPSLPKEILDVQTVTLYGGLGLSFTLDPSFPFTKAQVTEATITFPSWVKELYPMYINDRKAAWHFQETVYPGQVNSWFIDCLNVYTLEDGEGIREPGHRLALDGTIVLDGILTVDENDRKHPEESSSSWDATFLCEWRTESTDINAIKGRLDLSRKMDDCSITYNRVPAFLQMAVTVLDLDDLYGTVKIQNGSPAPVSVSGVIRSDEREYSFGERFGLSPVVAPRDNEPYRGLLSEKGGRVPPGKEDRYCDVPLPGFSRAIDSDPVSFALNDLRIQNDTETPYSFVFGEDNRVSIQALISSPLLIGENFQAVHRMSFEDIPESVDKVARIKGSMTAENSFPFDYELYPLLYDRNWKEIEVRSEPVRIPAGSRESPEVVPLSFEWTVDHAAVRFMDVKLVGRTAKNRQGEALYQDQHLTLKDLTIELY